MTLIHARMVEHKFSWARHPSKSALEILSTEFPCRDPRQRISWPIDETYLMQLDIGQNVATSHFVERADHVVAFCTSTNGAVTFSRTPGDEGV